MRKKVLIVDDNDINLYMLESLLKGSGLDVISAVNGKEALAKARLDPPDLIVTDILMRLWTAIPYAGNGNPMINLNISPLFFTPRPIRNRKTKNLL